MTAGTRLVFAGGLMIGLGKLLSDLELGFAVELGLLMLGLIVYVVLVYDVEEDATKWRNLQRGRQMVDVSRDSRDKPYRRVR